MADIREDRYGDDDEKSFAKETLRGERAIIGAIILDNSLMKQALENLLPRSFNILAHQPIFAAMVELDKRGEKISAESITNELRSRGKLGAAGGEEYVKTLNEDVPRALTAEQHDYVDRFTLVTIGKAASAAALSDEFSAEEVARFFFEKTQKFRELKGWVESPLLKSDEDQVH